MRDPLLPAPVAAVAELAIDPSRSLFKVILSRLPGVTLKTLFVAPEPVVAGEGLPAVTAADVRQIVELEDVLVERGAGGKLSYAVAAFQTLLDL